MKVVPHNVKNKIQYYDFEVKFYCINKYVNEEDP